MKFLDLLLMKIESKKSLHLDPWIFAVGWLGLQFTGLFAELVEIRTRKPNRKGPPTCLHFKLSRCVASRQYPRELTLFLLTKSLKRKPSDHYFIHVSGQLLYKIVDSDLLFSQIDIIGQGRCFLFMPWNLDPPPGPGCRHSSYRAGKNFDQFY